MVGLAGEFLEVWQGKELGESTKHVEGLNG